LSGVAIFDWTPSFFALRHRFFDPKKKPADAGWTK
jgi:hypothetical protein